MQEGAAAGGDTSTEGGEAMNSKPGHSAQAHEIKRLMRQAAHCLAVALDKYRAGLAAAPDLDVAVKRFEAAAREVSLLALHAHDVQITDAGRTELEPPR